jgi:hypothetical protein
VPKVAVDVVWERSTGVESEGDSNMKQADIATAIKDIYRNILLFARIDIDNRSIKHRASALVP